MHIPVPHLILNWFQIENEAFPWRPFWVETKRETSCYKHVLGKCHESVASPHNLLTFMLRTVNHSFQQVEFGRNSI